MIKVPHFETEREEADWWYENQALLEIEFQKAIRAGAKTGPSRALRAMAEARGLTVEEFRQQLKDSRSVESEPLTKLPRSA